VSQPLKPITLNFTIPANIDTPSETLLRMRTLMLEALERAFRRDKQFQASLSDEERVLCQALLTES
jgi:hypothetical protein